jgi:hypothetical protein
MNQYGYTVAYSKYSSVLGGCASEQEAINGAIYHINYYKELGYPIREATAYQLCTACEAMGRIVKYTKTGLVRSDKQCRTCNGIGHLNEQAIAY